MRWALWSCNLMALPRSLWRLANFLPAEWPASISFVLSRVSFAAVSTSAWHAAPSRSSSSEDAPSLGSPTLPTPAANDPGSKPTLEPLRPGNLKPKALKALKNQGLEAYNTRQNLSLSPKSPKAQSPASSLNSWIGVGNAAQLQQSNFATMNPDRAKGRARAWVQFCSSHT